MTGELRCRPLSATLELAVPAAAAAGVTRVSDVSAFAVLGVPVFQATRPAARSLTVSQGKGLTAAAAIVGALLESIELHSAEALAPPGARRALAELGGEAVAIWSGPRDARAIDLDRTLARDWLAGADLLSGRTCPMPWDLLSLDYTQDVLEYPATSVGLACGNTRTEALVSGVAELLEQHSFALFERLSPRERLDTQIDLATIDDPTIRQVLRRVEAAGFQVKAWSMANEAGFPAILCTLFGNDICFDGLAPASGSGCHASSRTAFLRALLEAVQTRAGLVAGARDDVTHEDYGNGDQREVAIVFGSFAFGDGPLDWNDVPGAACPSSEHCLEFLLAKAQRASNLPVVAYEHAPPAAGLHLAHVLAPGLLERTRAPEGRTGSPAEPAAESRESRRGARPGPRKLVFAGPSIAGLRIPDGIGIRPPARCGDLAALLDDPPAAVGLIDGYFKTAPTVWHKEIMALLARGTRVIGGASLGALRAAELERCGMEGVGEIFLACRSGALTRDDAVMLVHAPAELGYAPLSVPLVDAEHTLFGADLPLPALRAMQRIVRTASFETRTWRSCLAEYRRRMGEDFPLSAEALERAPSLKQSDARRVIEALEHDGTAAASKDRAMPPLTCHFRALLARTARASASAPT